MKLANIIAFPFMIAALILMYILYEYSMDYVIYLIPTVLIIAAVYILSPQINWFWYKKRPPALPAQVTEYLYDYIPFYKNLSIDEKKRFRNRISLYVLANDYQIKGMEKFPYDIKVLIAGINTQLTFGKEDYLQPKFEHIIAYPDIFPSPAHPTTKHASEIYEEDGVILFSIKNLMEGLHPSQNGFNIGLYEYARVFKASNPSMLMLKDQSINWAKINEVFRLSQEGVEESIGLPDTDLSAVLVTLFFEQSEVFKKSLTEQYDHFTTVFNLDPAQKKDPVVNPSLINNAF